MVRITGGVLVLLLAVPALPAEDKPATPAEQYRAILKEYQNAMQAFQTALRDAKTDEERNKVFQEKYPKPDKFAPRFLEFAEKNAKDPVAVEALVWVVNNTRGMTAGNGGLRTKAIDLLLREHVQSDKLAQVCPMMAYAFDKPSETFLRTVLEKNPHTDVQGQACLALGQYLKMRTTLLARLDNQPDFARLLESQLGKETLKELQGQDPAKVAKEIEGLFERAAEKYADVKSSFGGTVGDKAKAELYEIRHLAVGKVAPDIDGEDQDGKKFKLSDYKGKVVLLDFWSQY